MKNKVFISIQADHKTYKVNKNHIVYVRTGGTSTEIKLVSGEVLITFLNGHEVLAELAEFEQMKSEKGD